MDSRREEPITNLETISQEIVKQELVTPETEYKAMSQDLSLKKKGGKETESQETAAQEIHVKKIDERYMKAAIKEAQKAETLGEVPIGCVIVYQDKIISRGYNKRITEKNVLSHAELIAIKKACRKLGDWRLEECTMYVTLEPCPMCAGAIVQARIPEVVIGCMNPKAGCAGSVLDMLHEDGFNHQVITRKGILKEECSQMLTLFFKALRQARQEKKKQQQKKEA